MEGGLTAGRPPLRLWLPICWAPPPVPQCPRVLAVPSCVPPGAMRSGGRGPHLSNVLPNRCLPFQTSEEGPV